MKHPLSTRYRNLQAEIENQTVLGRLGWEWMKPDFQFAVQGDGEFDQGFQTEVVGFPGFQLGNERLADPNPMGQLCLGQPPALPKADEGIHDSEFLQLLLIPLPESPVFEERFEDLLVAGGLNGFHSNSPPKVICPWP